MSRSIKCFMLVDTGQSIRVSGVTNGKQWSCERTIWRREDTGQEGQLHEFGPGAMWFADWLNEFNPGPDGRCLIVRTPGGDWCIDSRATNCTMPNDNEHRCWIRHGEPPNITVDKNGQTCKAGGGSIQAGNYHGFLRGGFLVD